MTDQLTDELENLNLKDSKKCDCIKNFKQVNSFRFYPLCDICKNDCICQTKGFFFKEFNCYLYKRCSECLIEIDRCFCVDKSKKKYKPKCAYCLRRESHDDFRKRQLKPNKITHKEESWVTYTSDNTSSASGSKKPKQQNFTVFDPEKNEYVSPKAEDLLRDPDYYQHLLLLENIKKYGELTIKKRRDISFNLYSPQYNKPSWLKPFRYDNNGNLRFE